MTMLEFFNRFRQSWVVILSPVIRKECSNLSEARALFVHKIYVSFVRLCCDIRVLALKKHFEFVIHENFKFQKLGYFLILMKYKL